MESPRGALPMVLHASGLLVGRRPGLDMAAVPPGVELAVIPPPCPTGVQPVDFSRADTLIQQGYLEASRFLAARSRRQSPRARRQPARARLNPRRAA